MTIEEARESLNELIEEENRELRDLDYGEDVDGNPVYEPWQYTFEKGICMSVISNLIDLQDILTDSLLSEAEIRERFIARADEYLKKWDTAAKEKEYPEGYQPVASRILDIRCRFGMNG